MQLLLAPTVSLQVIRGSFWCYFKLCMSYMTTQNFFYNTWQSKMCSVIKICLKKQRCFYSSWWRKYTNCFTHLLQHIHQWPVCTSPRRPQTGHAWRGGSLHSWAGPGGEEGPRQGRPGNLCPLQGCPAPLVHLQGCFPCHWPPPSLELCQSEAFPRRLHPGFSSRSLQWPEPIYLPLLRCPGVSPVRSP